MNDKEMILDKLIKVVKMLIGWPYCLVFHPFTVGLFLVMELVLKLWYECTTSSKTINAPGDP